MTASRRRAAASAVRRARVAAQLLHRPSTRSVTELVRHLVGVQAQLPSAVQLALRARSGGVGVDDERRAREDDRSVVKTWAMRGTLHLVAAEDARWLATMCAPAQVSTARRRLAQLGVRDPDVALEGVTAALEPGPATRAEVVDALRRRDVAAEGQAVYHLLRFGGLHGLVCYGANRGGEETFVLLDDWIGRVPNDRRDGAELARRYLESHAPADARDLAAWSGLGVRAANAAFSALGDRIVETDGGVRLRSRRPAAAADVVRLVPAFDPYLLGWRDRSFAVPARFATEVNRGGGWVHGVALVDGRAVATWRVDRRRGGAAVRLMTFRRAPSRAFDREVRDVEAFLARG